MESKNPGFSYQLLKAVIQKAGVENRVEIAESILRMEGSNHSDGNYQKKFLRDLTCYQLADTVASSITFRFELANIFDYSVFFLFSYNHSILFYQSFQLTIISIFSFLFFASIFFIFILNPDNETS